MSRVWRPRCSGRPSVMRSASTIMPAQVPSAGRPRARASRTAPARPILSISMVIVVLSPPGMTSPSRPSRSSGNRTKRVRAPASSKALTCSRKSPCRAITPMSGRSLICLPTATGEQLLPGDRRELDATHRLAQTGRYLGQDLRLVVIGGGGDDRLGHPQRVLGLEDAGADEVAVAAELHHQR